VGQQISRLDGKQKSEGLELEVQWQPMPNWQLQAGLAYNKTQVTESALTPTLVGRDLSNAPRVTGNFWTRYNFPKGGLKGLGLGLGYIYVDKQWTGAPNGTLYYQVPSWARTDLAIYKKFKRYDVAVNINNLFDKRYISAPQNQIISIPGEARKLTLSLSFRL
jgi:iron complex outermembrane receptor protein